MISTGIRLVENHVSNGSRGQKKIILNDILKNKQSLSHCTLPAFSFHLTFVCHSGREGGVHGVGRFLPLCQLNRPSSCQQPTTFVGVQGCGPISVLALLLTDEISHHLNVRTRVGKRRKTLLQELGAVEDAQTHWRATGQNRHP